MTEAVGASDRRSLSGGVKFDFKNIGFLIPNRIADEHIVPTDQWFPRDRSSVACYRIERLSKDGKLIMTTVQPNQTDSNYEAFVALLPKLLQERRGSYALMHDGEAVDFFDDGLAATLEGAKRFGSGYFSVQEVTDEPEHLGFYSYVGGSGSY